MNAVVLAAGKGERMRPLSLSTPKPLVEVHGKPLAAWLLRALARAGVKRAVVVVRYKAALVEKALGKACEGVRLVYARQGRKKGTGAALLAAREKARPPLLACNADVVLAPFAYRALARARGCVAAMAVRWSARAERYGVARLRAGRVAALCEKPRGRGLRAWVNAGAYAFFSPALFEDLAALAPGARGEVELTDLLKRYLAGGGVAAVRCTGPYWDIGSPEELEAANQRRNPFS